jgi:hypothetical protein
MYWLAVQGRKPKALESLQSCIFAGIQACGAGEPAKLYILYGSHTKVVQPIELTEGRLVRSQKLPGFLLLTCPVLLHARLISGNLKQEADRAC